MADDSTELWGTALRDVGLVVRDVGTSPLELDEPGAIGQFVDETTGAVLFAMQGDAATSAEGSRLVRIVSRGRGRLTAPSWERDFRTEQLRWFRKSDRDVPAQNATVDLDGLARISVGPSLLLLHDWLGRTDIDFAALDEDLHEMLSDRYEGRVLGYDHHTLCVEPAQNAQALGAMLSQLKRQLVLDVVGLGRGGLVARELAERRQFSALSIDKVVTVGTPHTGTPLADRGAAVDARESVRRRWGAGTRHDARCCSRSRPCRRRHRWCVEWPRGAWGRRQQLARVPQRAPEPSGDSLLHDRRHAAGVEAN